MKKLLAALVIAVSFALTAGTSELAWAQDPAPVVECVQPGNEIVAALHARYPQDNIYLFAGENFETYFAALVAEVGEPPMPGANGIMVMDGASDGVPLVTTMVNGCIADSINLSMDVYNRIWANAFPAGGIEPSIKAGSPVQPMNLQFYI